MHLNYSNTVFYMKKMGIKYYEAKGLNISTINSPKWLNTLNYSKKLEYI